MKKLVAVLSVMLALTMLVGCGSVRGNDSSSHYDSDIGLQNSGDATIPNELPEDVQILIKSYMSAYKNGADIVSAEYLHFEVEFSREAYQNSGDRMIDYIIESAEKINDNLYSLTVLIKTELSVIYQGGAYEHVYNFVGKIGDQWYYINGVSNIPSELRENLDETKYTYPYDENSVPLEDVIHD